MSTGASSGIAPARRRWLNSTVITAHTGISTNKEMIQQTHGTVAATRYP